MGQRSGCAGVERGLAEGAQVRERRAPRCVSGAEGAERSGPSHCAFILVAAAITFFKRPKFEVDFVPSDFVFCI